MVRLDALRWAEPTSAGRRETLARMRAAGLAVADGVVVLPGEAVDSAALEVELARLSGAARRTGVSPCARRRRSRTRRAGRRRACSSRLSAWRRRRSRAAIETVRASADAPAVAAYLAARGLSRAQVRLAVLIQPVVAAEAYGVAHSSAALGRREG